MKNSDTHKTNKHFVSDFDQYLMDFDKANQPSAIQQAEYDKHRQVFLKRQLKDSTSA